MKEQREKERILPEIDRMNSLIAEMNQDIAQSQSKIEKEEKSNADLEEKLNLMDIEKESKKDIYDSL
jgi:hypothetical protein